MATSRVGTMALKQPGPNRRLFGLSQQLLGQYTFCYIALLPVLAVYTFIRIIPILRARQPGAAVVMMTAYQTIPNAVEAIRRGA